MQKKWVALLASLMLMLAAASAGASTFNVTTSADSGAGSLRQAILNANFAGGSNIIEVETSVKEIVLTSTINIESNNLTLNGNGVTVKGAGLTRLFGVSSGAVLFDKVTFTNGYSLSDSGGAVAIDSSAGKADFVNCTFFDNRAGKNGGAINVYGGGSFETTFVNCTLTGNTAGDNGGGVSISGGTVRFTASIVAGNKATFNDDVHTESNGVVTNTGQFNVVGKTNAVSSFLPSFNNNLSVAAADIFKTPGTLTTVNGVQIMDLLSATRNVALDKISSTSALSLNLPAVDARAGVRPQMLALDAGSYELSPIALASIDLKGSFYVQKGKSEPYSAGVHPENATLNVREYVNGIAWTVSDSNIISVDAYGNVTGLANGKAVLRATAYGWNASGAVITATEVKNIQVGDDPLPAPTITLSFTNPKTEMAVGERYNATLDLKVEPVGTLYEIVYYTSDPFTATVTQQSTLSRTVTVEAVNPGETYIRAVVKAENGSGKEEREVQYKLTVLDVPQGGGGGGCNSGLGLSALAMGILLMLKRRGQ